MVFQFILLVLLVLSIGFAVFFKIKNNAFQKEKVNSEKRLTELETQFSSLHIDNLESRLNPHLLKNILNSIQSHAYQTYFALDKLGNVLDYILYESKHQFVSPKQEIEFAMNLIEINKIKISPLFELKIKTNINENEPLFSKNVMVPLMSVDLIENAFKHADLQSQDSFISVIFEFKNDTFIQTVSNKISTSTPLKKDHSGLGNEILENRLRINYKDNFKLEKYAEGDVFISQLKIKLFEH